MNEYIYDPITNGFYPLSLKSDYTASGTWPEGGTTVSGDVFFEYTNPPESKVRVAGEDGFPAWGDIPPLTHEEQVAAADADKQNNINTANGYMNSKQWPGKAAMGRLNGAEKGQYNAWLDYLDTLEAVDTSLAPDIIWPTAPPQ